MFEDVEEKVVAAIMGVGVVIEIVITVDAKLVEVETKATTKKD